MKMGRLIVIKMLLFQIEWVIVMVASDLMLI